MPAFRELWSALSMQSENILPQIESCIELYMHAWTLFGEQLFTPVELSRRIIEEDRDTSAISGADEPTGQLELLVAYGLLGRDEEKQYWVRCTPSERSEKWRQKQRVQLEALREQVTNQYEQCAKESASGGTTDSLQCEGSAYMRVVVEETETPTTVVEKAIEKPDEATSVVGITLCCPAAQAGHAQRLADSLCDDSPAADADTGRFEKVTSTVVGEHKDDLEYRLFLRRSA